MSTLTPLGHDQLLPSVDSDLIFGGAFDPPHLGHDHVVRDLLAATGANIWISPTFQPRLKSNLGVSSQALPRSLQRPHPYALRLAWAKAWITSFEQASQGAERSRVHLLDEQELYRAQNLPCDEPLVPSSAALVHRIETARQTQSSGVPKLPQGHLTWVVGLDQLPLLPKWIQYPAILNRVSWIWVKRRAHPSEPNSFNSQIWETIVAQHPHQKQWLLETQTPAISSSDLWEQLVSQFHQSSQPTVDSAMAVPEPVRHLLQNLLNSAHT